jgi:hypothetical protein
MCECLAAISSYYVCKMYEFVQLYPHIMSVKCTNVSSYLFVLRLWNVRMFAAISSYYVREVYEYVRLYPHIMSAICTNLSSCLFILRLWNVRMCPAISLCYACEMYDCVQLLRRLSFHSQEAPDLPINVSCTSDQSCEFSSRMQSACGKRL